LITGIVGGLVGIALGLVLSSRFLFVNYTYYHPDLIYDLTSIISKYSQSGSGNIVILLVLYGGGIGAIAPTTINKLTTQLKSKLQQK